MRRLDPQWWTTGTFAGQRLLDVLARRDIGMVFQALHARGWSWAAIAAATDMTASRVGEIARGRRRVTEYDVFTRIADGLGIPRHHMGLGYGTETPTPVTPAPPIDHRELVGAVAAITVNSIPADIARWLPIPGAAAPPSIVTEHDVATIRAVTRIHRQLDAGAGGGSCLQSATAYVAWATRLLHIPTTRDDVGRDLRTALAELHSLVGWVAHDLDQHDTARRHLAQGLVLARETGALQLAANILYRLGRVSLHQRDAEGALHLFGLGQIVAQQARCPASIAILHNNSAWAYALLGADDQVHESLRRGRAELESTHPDDVPLWTRFAFADADPHGLTAVIYTALARHPQHRQCAENALAEALQAVTLRLPEDRRSLTFDLISAATAATLLGDYDNAAKWGLDAMGHTDQIRSARVRDRLTDMWQLAMPVAERHPDLQHLGHRLAAQAAA